MNKRRNIVPGSVWWSWVPGCFVCAALALLGHQSEP